MINYFFKSRNPFLIN